MYIMFPIAIMYYYGTNLDRRFSVPDFWPKPEQTNRIPFEKEEIHSELERLRQRRLYLREKRLEQDKAARRGEGENGGSS
jgi:protein PET100